jgi:hypothetical protein
MCDDRKRRINSKRLCNIEIGNSDVMDVDVGTFHHWCNRIR